MSLSDAAYVTPLGDNDVPEALEGAARHLREAATILAGLDGGRVWAQSMERQARDMERAAATIRARRCTPTALETRGRS